MRQTHALALTCLMLISGAAKAEKRIAFSDVSGKIKTVVVDCEDPRGPGQVVWAPCYIPSDLEADYVVVGGGAEIVPNNGAPGAMLTGSYPNDSLSMWNARSKDHLVAFPHRLKSYAIVLKLEGISKQELLDEGHIYLARARSAQASHPSVTVTVDPGYIAVGGGARVNWTGAGQLLVASRPGPGADKWYAEAKDHSTVSPAQVDAFAIAVRAVIPGWGRIIPHPSPTRFCQTVSGGYNDAQILFSNGALTSIGGTARYSGQGRMLTMLKPVDSTFQYLVRAQSKDHVVGDSNCTDAYAMGLTWSQN